ncbi:MAG: hypothetical protein J6B87_04820 [Clostridia bacterium]|nr:hypothetical protein [Clostridia bacterium]
MKKHLKSSKHIIAVLLLTIILFTSNVSFAAWWATPGYEWGLTRGLTSVKSRTQLNQTVTHSDFYSIILKYLELKEIQPEGKLVHHADDMAYLNNVVAGMFNLINTYTSRSYLTPDEYRQVESYVEHARGTFERYKEYLTRNSVKNIDLYLKLSQYKAATIINDREYKELALSRLGRVKNADIFTYGMIPYAGDITRREFLLLMFDLLSSQDLSDEQVITSFNEAGVLLGYQSDLMLDKQITYSEMLTFLYRFEIYDFNPVVEETDEIEENETVEK